MDNKEIAEIFVQIGEILEIKDENRFKINAYYRAAEVISSYPYDLHEIWQKDPEKLKEIPGVGESLAEKIDEMFRTGKSKYLEKLLEHFNRGILELLTLRGVGPKKVKLFYHELGIDTLAKLEEAAKKHLIRVLPRMGEKTENSILEAIEEHKRFKERQLLSDALSAAEKLIDFFKKSPAVHRAEYAGSLRRRRETIGDIDILAVGSDHKAIIDHFCTWHEITNIIARGETKSSVILKIGMQVDLRVLKDHEFGAAWHYFTGSKEHNVAIRDRAKKMGLKVNEYGVFKKNKKIAGKTEEEVFKAIKLPYIPPEIRENRGEIEAAEKGQLPVLIEMKDLKGDLHIHTNWSDGSQSLEEVVEGARKYGFKYIAITDHSRSARVANGLDEKRLLKQIKEIDELQKRFQDFIIFKGSEVDIMADGRLDFSDEILAQLDIIIGSIHSKFRLPRDEQTARLMNALKNPYLTILGHPTARLINRREPIDVDMEKVIDTAKKHRKILEINANPHRLDLNDSYIRMAKEKGVILSIDSDSHHTSGFGNLIYGIYIARRGWIEKKDILNTRNDIRNLKKNYLS